MRVKVLNNQTQQIGTVEDSELAENPHMFTPLQGDVAQNPATPDTAQNPDLVSRAGDFVINAAKGIAKPFVDTTKNILAAEYLPVQAAVSSAAGAIDPALGARIASYDPMGLQKVGADVTNHPVEALRKQMGNNAQILSYGVPFGAGGNILTKAVLPGAVVGAVNEAGQEAANNEDLNAGRIVGSGAIGGITAGVLHGVSQLPRILSKSGDVTEEVGTRIRNSGSKVYLPPKVGGAQEEAEVERILNSRGVQGSASNRYAQLKPTMNEIGGEIRGKLEANPQPISEKAIRSQALSSLEGELRSKSINSKAANDEIVGYLKDVGNIAKNDTVMSPDFFDLKQKVGRDYQPIQKKINMGVPLNDREQAIKAVWNSMDDIITALHPEVKQLTLEQSALYKAAKPLSTARKNPATLRAFGFSLPKPATEIATTLGGKTIQGVGNVMSGVGNTLPTIASSTAANIGSRLPAIGNNINVSGNNSQNGANTAPDNGSQNDTTGNIQHENSITPQSTLTGYTPETLYAGYQKALANGDKAAAAQLRQMYTDETSYQKNKSGNAQDKQVRAANELTAALSSMADSYGLGTKNSLSAGANTVGLAAPFARGGAEYRKATSQDFADRLSAYKSQRDLIVGILNQARGAGTLNGNEFITLVNSMPDEYSSEGAAKAWFSKVKNLIPILAARSVDTSNQSQLPDITAQ